MRTVLLALALATSLAAQSASYPPNAGAYQYLIYSDSTGVSLFESIGSIFPELPSQNISAKPFSSQDCGFLLMFEQYFVTPNTNFLILSCGSNDIHRHHPLTQFESELGSLITNAQVLVPGIVIIVPELYPETQSAGQHYGNSPQDFVDYNSYIDSLPTLFQNVYVAPEWQYFALTDGWGNPDMLPDGLHPGPDGIGVYGGQIRDVLYPLIANAGRGR